MCRDESGNGWDDDYGDDHYVLIGGLIMGAAALFVVAVLVWVVR